MPGPALPVASQAREHLYFQLTGRHVTVPLAIMTSDAKGNHDRVLVSGAGTGRSRNASTLPRLQGAGSSMDAPPCPSRDELARGREMVL
jgi:hypothetical protein